MQSISVKMLAEAMGLGADAGIADRWYVSDGAQAVGPVNLELIARGIEAGKVPLESFVRHEAWRVWRPLKELALVSADSAAPTQRYHPRPPATIPHSTDDITQPGRPMFPEEMSPSDAFAGAADMADALLLLLNAAVMRSHADAALVHEVRNDGAVVLYAHGPFARDMIGARTSLLDPALAAAAEGASMMAEPAPGPAGQALLGRMLQLGVACEGACLVPVRMRGRLVAVLELGRKAPRLRGSEMGAVEALAEALASKADDGCWF
jgi:hypothetical protein